MPSAVADELPTAEGFVPVLGNRRAEPMAGRLVGGGAA